MNDYVVLLRANGEIEYPSFGSGFESLRKHVEYQWFEVIKRGKAVNPDTGAEVQSVILGDEEGLMNTPAAINWAASKVVGAPIVGDVFICGATKYDLRGFTEEELSTVRNATINSTLE